jgi:hypothetical protein
MLQFLSSKLKFKCKFAVIAQSNQGYHRKVPTNSTVPYRYGTYIVDDITVPVSVILYIEKDLFVVGLDLHPPYVL